MNILYKVTIILGLLLPCVLSIVVYRKEQDVISGLNDCNTINSHSRHNGMCACPKDSNTFTSLSVASPYQCHSTSETQCNITLLTLGSNIVYRNRNYIESSKTLSTLLCQYEHRITVWDIDAMSVTGRWFDATKELKEQFNLHCNNVSPYFAHINSNLWMGQLIRIVFKKPLQNSNRFEHNCLLIKFHGSTVYPLGINGLHRLISSSTNKHTVLPTGVITTAPPRKPGNYTHSFLKYHNEDSTVKYVIILAVIAIITIILGVVIYRRHQSDINIMLITSPTQNPDHQLRETGNGMFYESRGTANSNENNNNNNINNSYSKASYYLWNENFQKESVDYLQLEGANENREQRTQTDFDTNNDHDNTDNTNLSSKPSSEKGSIGRAFHNPLFEPDLKAKAEKVANHSNLLLPSYFSSCRPNEVNNILASPYCVKV